MEPLDCAHDAWWVLEFSAALVGLCAVTALHFTFVSLL